MKRFLCGMFLILASGSTWALEPVSVRNACWRLKPDSNIDACNKVIENAKFDEFAVGVCDRLESSRATLDCIKTIRHGTFESKDAIRVCERLKVPSDIIDCLGMIEFEHIQDEAVQVCDRIKNPEDTYDCMEAITARSYTSREIFECDRMQSDNETIGCFEVKGVPNPNSFDRGGMERLSQLSNYQRPVEEMRYQEKLNHLTEWAFSKPRSRSKSTK